MRPGHDRTGMEGMPLKLMITAIVMAITVPLMFTSLRAYDYSRIEQQLMTEIDDFSENVRLVYTAGVGNGALVDFQVPEGAFAKVEAVRMGDALGGERASVIGFELRGRPEVLRAIEGPCVPLSSFENGTLTLSPGHRGIRMECIQSCFDLNMDGLVPDVYVALAAE